ncbi:carboxypeptidase A [Colletotrichum phormii]|uniref:Carboxypeptidase A n=1 Tax=Colletotrichum phormii TaxID=359342 RepID=A0AAI9ZTF0_9PEZI|nr:carboxypeptidase A [Colletotrichum phormii]KAK1637879.1 carboxypeptidase A [Colletotrichum phormii]
MGNYKGPVTSFKKISKLVITALLSHGNTIQDYRLMNTANVNRIDRFHNGAKYPIGIGSNLSSSADDYQTVFSGWEVNSALKGLANEYGVQLTPAPFETYWNQKSTVAVLPVPDGVSRVERKNYRVYLTAGVQARERGGPDSLLYFISDLLWADKHQALLVYNTTTVFTTAQVRLVLSLGIIVFPLVNPDGKLWDERWNNCWGDNINPASSPSKKSIDGLGVNIDRNFNFTWDYRKIYSQQALDVASDKPGHELFHGTAPFSEVESRNMAWVIHQYPSIKWYLDTRTKNRIVSHAWSDTPIQTTNPEMNFRNQSYDGKRGDMATKYGEYMIPKDHDIYKDISNNMAEQMAHVSGEPFYSIDKLRKKGRMFQGSSGTAVDWAYSRHVVNDAATKIMSFKVKFGATEQEAAEIGQKGGCQYYPSRKIYKRGITESAVGYMTFLLNVAKYEKMKDPWP